MAEEVSDISCTGRVANREQALVRERKTKREQSLRFAPFMLEFEGLAR
jgi:hypothetical protein